MLVFIACIAVLNAWSIRSAALATVLGGFEESRVLSTFPTVWCILSQIAFGWGFLLVVGTSLIWHCTNSSWKSCPLNSPPLSCMYLLGHGYLASQNCSSLDLMCAEVFLSTLINSTKLVTISIHVNALNSYHLSLIFSAQGAILSGMSSNISLW